MNKIKEEKKIHAGYKEWEKAKKDGFDFPLICGKYHYIFSADKGKISLIKIKDLMGEGWLWEIYCLEGDLFESIERFNTKKEAVEKIKKYLKDNE